MEIGGVSFQMRHLPAATSFEALRELVDQRALSRCFVACRYRKVLEHLCATCREVEISAWPPAHTSLR